MVLVIEDQTYTSSCTLDHLARHSTLIEKSVQFTRSNEVIQPNEEIPRTIYVSQREFAVLSHNDPHGFHLLGSDDATTCHILVLETPSAVALAHLDGCETSKSIEAMLKELKEYSNGEHTNAYDVYLAGGFLDQSDRRYSKELSNDLLNLFARTSSETFYLRLAAITNYNDHLIGDTHYPLIYGICYDLRTKSMRKMSFVSHGPALRLRMIYHSTQTHPCYCLYSSARGEIHLRKFRIDRHLIDRYYRPLYQYYFTRDQELLRLTSTSPEQERPSYLINMKKQIIFLLQYHQQIPEWFDSKTNLIVFRWIDQQWKTENPQLIEDIDHSA